MDKGHLCGEEGERGGGQGPAVTAQKTSEPVQSEHSGSLPVPIPLPELASLGWKVYESWLILWCLGTFLHVLIGTREAVSANVFVP